MTTPAIATDELIDLISRHQVIDPEPLWQFLASRGGAAGLPPDSSDLVADLVREQMLTDYQGEQLLAGQVTGLVIGKYHLLSRLGGLDSSVYLAERRPGGQRVAIKVLSRDSDVRPAVIERFRREAEALARLDHPGIVGIKDSGEDNGRLFLVMEYIDGESLAEMVQRQGPLQPAPAGRIVQGALEALDHIHRAGLVHRNLEPGHLMLDRTGEVRIVDLGLARFLDEPGSNLTMLRGTSQLLGTVEYQSPEQLVNSHEVDIRTDVYALGAIFYFLLTGKAPFNMHALLRLAAGVLTHPQPLAQLRPDLPRPLVDLVEKMMARDAAGRFRTPADASTALDAWMREVSPAPLKVPTRRTSTKVPTVRPRPNDLLPGVEDEPAPPVESGLMGWVAAGLLFVVTVAVALAVMGVWKV